ncbi:MAG: PD-(D/E)XK nuclease family protein [Candidatus Bipolaricaulota bacterium]|nr:MAG: PD-(D/E)XK nuclease family protein [Candidatus Bipolaricaulota bacterium]
MKTYSYSRLSAFEICPQKYRFRYIDRVKVDVGPTIEAFLGSRVHDALEWLYDLLLHGRTPSAKELLSVYEKRWEEEWSEDTRIVKTELTAESYHGVGCDLLQRYYDRHSPFHEGIVLGLEKPFRFALDDGHTLNGFIDRLMRATDGTIEVHDYKTGGTLADPEQAAVDRQAGIYDLAARHLFPEASEVRLVWHYLRFDEERVTTRTPLEREALREELLAAMRRIESEQRFAPRESALCDWCEYYSLCPAKAHRRALQGRPPEERGDDAGVVLVDRLVALREGLSEQRKEIEHQIEEVEERLVTFASDAGLATVVGTQYEAVIDREPRLAFPAKGDTQREALEEEIRRSGLWDRVTDISLARLRSLLASGAVEEDLAARIREHAVVEPRATVRLR